VCPSLCTVTFNFILPPCLEMLKRTGEVVFPGDIVMQECDEMSCGVGCQRERGSIRATLKGMVQYDDSTVSVVASTRQSYAAPSTQNDRVVLRITKSSRHAAVGTIIAIDHGNGQFSWCHAGGMSGFKGSIRSEDIRPVTLKSDVDEQFLAAFPASSVTASGAVVLPAYASFIPGDVVVAKVLSQVDTRQFQLTTLDGDLGCISTQDSCLVPAPGRRDRLINSETGAEVSRWCVSYK
jgi:exosome complex RNA-binding protein Csl4